MAMIVEIFFLKLEGSSMDQVKSHHVEVIDVVDQKAITRCWETVAQKFGMKASDMYVYEGYLTHSEVSPTADDLQRIWLSYLEQEDQINTELCHLCLRLFVSNKSLKPTTEHKSTPRSTEATATATATATAAATTSAATTSASETKTASASSSANADNGLGVMVGEEILVKGEDWVRMAEAINMQMLLTTKDSTIHQNSELIDLMGRGLSALVKMWWLFTQTGLNKSNIAAVHNVGPQSQLAAAFQQFPRLQTNPAITQNLNDANQFFQTLALFTAAFTRTNVSTTNASANVSGANDHYFGYYSSMQQQNQPGLDFNPRERTYNAVESYIQRLPTNMNTSSSHEIKERKTNSSAKLNSSAKPNSLSTSAVLLASTSGSIGLPPMMSISTPNNIIPSTSPTQVDQPTFTAAPVSTTTPAIATANVDVKK